jgi:ABC-type transport system involved in multi-copper enzyme maturation permease subunit
MLSEYDAGTPSPGLRIVGSLSESDRQAMVEFSSAEDQVDFTFFQKLQSILDSWNVLLSRRDLYRPEDWEDTSLGSEARALLDTGVSNLTDTEVARLNRLLIELPYEEHFRPQPTQQIVITYVGTRISPPIRVGEQRVKEVIELVVLPLSFELLLGPVALLTAVLVTAPIIPQMFDPGVLSLLLSKPLSRSLMFMAKFIGGCAFILINAGYFFTGLWLLLGWRLGIWNHGFLLCILIFLFLFAVYYSVSAFTGVVWRNAIVCVVLTVLFWFACWVVGMTKNGFEAFLVETQRINCLVEAGDTLMAVDELGAAKRWDADQQQWEASFLDGSFGRPQRVLGPVYDTQNRMLLAATYGHHGIFQSAPSLVLARADDGWRALDGPALPESTFELLPDPDGRLLAVTLQGVEQLVGELEAKESLKVFFMEIPQSLGKPFRHAGPATKLQLSRPAVAAIDAGTGSVAVYSRGQLLLLTRQGQDYQLAHSTTVDAEEEEGAALAFGGHTIVLALSDGRVLTYDAASLQQRGQYRPEPYSQGRFAYAAPDGRSFAILFHNARLHLLRVAEDGTETLQLADVRGQDGVSAALFTSRDTLLVADRVKRVTEYQLNSMEIVNQFAPSLTALENAYYYAVRPLHTLFPKPGELDNTIQFLLQNEETTDLGMQPGDLQAKRERLHPWAPVRSSLIFTLIMLAGACFYIERQDF